MTHAEETLKFELAQKIHSWVDEQCTGEEWGEIKVILPPESAHRMTEAAFAIFRTIYEAQQFAIKEGYVKITI